MQKAKRSQIERKTRQFTALTKQSKQTVSKNKEAVKNLDCAKVQKLLSSPAKKKTEESLCWNNVDTGHKIRVELRHINVNIRETDTGYTPLLLAVLHGSKEIAERLIFNCADVTAMDVKGNTALHLAVFHGRLDIVDLMLFNDAEINLQNEDGNTALHIACQAAVDQRVKIICKLIQSGANAWIVNKYSLMPLDVAAMFNRVDAVSALLENVPTLVDNRVALVEAALRGCIQSVEILLEHGIDPSRLDSLHGSSPLHEAVRFNRLEAVKLLLDFQADADLENMRKETPRKLASQLPSALGEKMLKVFDEQSDKPARLPKLRPHTESFLLPPNAEEQQNKLIHIKDYPPLPNDVTWTQNRPVYCSSCTEKNTNLNILDDNLRTLWVVPVLHNAWTILNLRTEHVLTGITIYGWNSPQMLRSFQIQIADSIEGPWTLVSTHTCGLLGSTDPKDEAFPQEFKGFTVQTRYLRLYLVDNHGGSYICFHGIRLHGVDTQVLDCLSQCGLTRVQESFVSLNLNTWKRFLDITQEQVNELVPEVEKRAALWEAVYKGRREMYPMTRLTWIILPVASAFVGETLPELSIQSDPGVTEVVHLIAQGAVLSGNTEQRLSCTGENKPSAATFTDISISPAGLYLLQVKGVSTDITLASPIPTEVRPQAKSESEIASAFDEIQQMLSQVHASLDS
ncbi:ankyrin-2 [Plakobranchus ocellatus]|uniref:Ankyrin-2 n=1 Tax=Plakobranchus ocellatus TaxID=259542 RepID=A0AAV4ALR9_9GAST|nr:ankyrin-2 [Plakobranchus ocellatus]